MKKRFAVFLAAALAALCLPSAWALAEEPEAEALSAPEPRSAVWSAAEAEDSDDLFSVFVAARLYGGGTGEAPGAAGSRLEGAGRAVYDALLPRIIQTADRGGSTVFILTAEELGLPTRWALRQPGVPGAAREMTGGLLDRPEYQFDLEAVMSALLADRPYELYWFQKAGDGSGNGGVEMTLAAAGAESGGGGVILSGLAYTFRFHVARGYRQGGLPFMVRTDVSSLASARAAVQGILAETAGGSDYEKLTAYRDAVLTLADRDEEAGGVEYGDPWQLIWVFDGDSNTTATCEGYAKAFQYLCGLGGLEDAECYTVDGLLDGGAGAVPHMWNIVRVGSKNYLVDLASSDMGGVGALGGLFLAGAQADYSTDPRGYAVTLPGGNTVSYNYNEHYTDPWGKDVLLEPAEEDYVPGAAREEAAGALPG